MSDETSTISIARHLSEEQREKFIEKCSRSYPLSEEMIGRFPLLWDWEALSKNESLEWSISLLESHEDRWNWSGYGSLSSSEFLPWSEELIARFEDKWDWEELSEKKELPWSEELIARYEERWDWRHLSSNEALPCSEELIARYEEHWNWTILSSSEALPWSEELITRYEERWTWSSLSGNEALPWSEELTARYEERWTWLSLSGNEALPWSEELIARFEEQWNWGSLSGNEALPWSEELIARFEERWDWEELSKNEALPWSEELIARYEEQWDWEDLSENEALPWSEELIARYEDRWDWEELSKNESLEWSISLLESHEDRWNWSGPRSLSSREFLPWSTDLIVHFKDKWSWSNLSSNRALPWSVDLIVHFKDKWRWPSLSINEALPWSEELIARFEDRWDWEYLNENEALPWSEELIARFENRWDRGQLQGEVVAKHVAPEEIQAVLASASEDLDFTFSEERRRLLQAAQDGDVQAARDLVGAGTDPDIGLTSEDAPEVALLTPLLRACKEGHTAVAEVLLDAGADPDASDRDGRTALDVVAENGTIPLARLLLSAGADPTVSDTENLADLAHENGRAAIADVLHIGSTLLEHDPEFETLGDEGGQGMFEAKFGQTDSVWDEAAERLEEQGLLGKSDSEPSKFDLLRAVRDGEMDRVRQLLDAGIDPNVTAADRYLTPLLVATAFGQQDAANLLLQNGAHPALGLSLGEKTCLMVAATCGEEEVVSALLEAGADMHIQSRDGQPRSNGNRDFHGSTALVYAIHEGRVGAARSILSAAADIGPLSPDQILSPLGPDTLTGDSRNSNNQALLHTAVRNGNLEMTELLLEYGIPADQTDSNERTPLDIAQSEGDEKAAELLQRREDQGEKDRPKDSAREAEESLGSDAASGELVEAVLEGNADRVEELIDAGADPSAKDESGAPLVHRANDTEVLDVLLNAGVDPDVRDDYSSEWSYHKGQNREVLGGTRLHFWHDVGPEVAERLLEAGADPNARDLASWATPLYYNVDEVLQEDISVELLSLLLESGADPDARTYASRVPLHGATGAMGDLEVTRLLLDAGADPNIPGDHEERDFPLHTERNPEIMSVLLEAGADPNALNRQRLTPLMGIAKWGVGTLEQMECLLENGADPNIGGATGMTVLHLLAENTDLDADFRREATDLLLNQGADPSLTDDWDSTPYELARDNDNSVVADILY